VQVHGISVVVRTTIVIAIAAGASACGGTAADRSFDPAAWKKGDAHRLQMVNDLMRRDLHPGARKSSLYELLGWPEYFSGYDYDYSRKWSYCLHSEEEDAFMSHARCTRGVDIYFAAPNYARVTAVKLTSGDRL
jgi:outer membrane protein assembly factor BamE (lipoprotein component of BamABCDE complex)